jgi:uncharacterized membrane protein YeiH
LKYLSGQFELPFLFDIAATFLFGISGALAGVRRGYDYVGVFVLTFVTGVGGGLIRDGIFLQQGPPVIMRQRGYLLAIIAACVAGSYLGHHIERFKRVFLMFDAVGMAAYGVVGVKAALSTGLGPISAVFIGVVNATGGGILRDIITNEEPLIFKPGQYYALASLIGCTILVILIQWVGIPSAMAGLIGMGITFILRLLAIIFNLQTSPVKTAPPPASGDQKPPKGDG